MPSTAPALTWQQTNLRTSADPTSAQECLDALALAVGDSTTWRVVTSGAGFLEIGPVVNSPTTDDYVNFRLIIAFGIDAAQRQEPHETAAVDANELWMGIAPEGGSVGIIGGGPLTAADPYTTRWSLYWRCSSILTGVGPVHNLYVLTSDEIFGFFFRDQEDEDWWGGFAGALFDPPTDADGEGTPGRVYGMATSGRDAISATFWQNANDFLCSGTGNVDPCIGCFRPALTSRWTLLDRSTSAGELRPHFETEAGSVMAIPVPYWQAGVTTLGSSGGVNPTNYIGILRQMRKTQDSLMRSLVLDNTGATQSYIVSGDTTNSDDALSVDNG